MKSLRANGDWEDYWRYHEQQELERNHRSKYAQGAAPPLTPASASFTSSDRPASVPRHQMNDIDQASLPLPVAPAVYAMEPHPNE